MRPALFVFNVMGVGHQRLIASISLVLCASLLLLAEDHEQSAGNPVGVPVRPPVILAKFADSTSTHENMVKPVRLTDDRLLALSITTHGRDQRMVGRYSTDNGQTWSTPEELFALPHRVGGFGYFDAFTDRNSEIHIFYLNDGNTGSVLPKSDDDPPVRSGEVLDIWQVKSTGKATRWEPAKSIWTGRAGDIVSVIQLKSGRILLPISYQTSRSWSKRGVGFRAYTYVGTYSSSAIFSDDGGNIWHQSPDELVVPVPDLSTIGGVEPVVLELKDGRIWMLIRTQMGRFYEAFSRDGGVHWTAPKPSNIVASESPAALVRLSDDRILMIWNEASRYPYAYGGRHVLHAAVSSDEGRTWRGHREILRDPLRTDAPPPNSDWGISYAFPVVARDNAVVFSTWVQTDNPRYLFRVDPRWLDETWQRTDFAQGIDDWSIFGTRGVELTYSSDGSHALAIRRADSDWPSGAVWNFPIGQKGRLRMRLMLRDSFGGDTLLGLTDHYSVPFDDQDTFYNDFNIPINANGHLLSVTLTPNRWHDLELSWDTARRECVVAVDGERAGSVQAQRISDGINYVRFHPMSDGPDGGLLLKWVDADVRSSWPMPVIPSASAPASNLSVVRQK